MTPTRKRRLYMVLGIIAGVGVAAGFGLKAYESRIGFKTPTDVLSGMVEPGKRSLEVRFVVADLEKQLPVVYSGVLPDLFKEKAGVVANGRMNAEGVFVADEVLAKHDENYMPPQLGKALKKGESRLESPPMPSSPQAN
jgi:cytochrome c-type biogenesis protein CcmE